MKPLYPGLFILMSVLSGCLHTDAGREANFLEGGRWILVQVMEQKEPFASVEEQPFIEFGIEAGRFGGFGGCNRFTGGFSAAEDGRLTLGPVAATRRFCPEMELEDLFLRTLKETDAYRIDGNELRLFDADGVLILRFTRN